MPGTPEETPGKPSGEGSGESSRERLEREVGVLPWSELARHFARGVVVVVDAELALIDVALAFTEDDSARAGAWFEGGQVARASDDDARGWVQHQPDFRCVVVAPWVLVQVQVQVQERG